MPTRNINLTARMDQYVDAKIRNGEYANASEVLRAGLRALEQNDREDRARIDALRAALIAGEQSGVAEGDVFSQVRERVRQRAAGRRKA